MNRPAEALAPSGEQYELRSGDHRAIVTEVGATLRHYSVHGVDVIDGFGADERSSDGRGQVLAPWPNRLDAGRYRFGDHDARAALDEPERNNAIHGLVRWLPFRAASRQDSAIEFACVLHPQPGYPWSLELRIGYRLGDGGLAVSFHALNRSSAPAPFGIGFHPYLTIGVPIDRAVLRIPAGQRTLTDDRGLPTGSEPVAGSAFDFTTAKAVGPMQLDTCYTDLVRDSDDIARMEIVTPEGDRGVTLWVDGSFHHVMVYTGDTVEPASRRRHAVAVEPMSCPPNAFRSAADVIAIEPGAGIEGRWGLQPS
ncbi:MAG TPA: aldose 1-epimerase family protein [Actinomycetota bacterium]|nr:aldose 1-epimerase family protein [Actinomycetota bacterium]